MCIRQESIIVNKINRYLNPNKVHYKWRPTWSREASESTPPSSPHPRTPSRRPQSSSTTAPVQARYPRLSSHLTSPLVKRPHPSICLRNSMEEINHLRIHSPIVKTIFLVITYRRWVTCHTPVANYNTITRPGRVHTRIRTWVDIPFCLQLAVTLRPPSAPHHPCWRRWVVVVSKFSLLMPWWMPRTLTTTWKISTVKVCVN